MSNSNRNLLGFLTSSCHLLNRDTGVTDLIAVVDHPRTAQSTYKGDDTRQSRPLGYSMGTEEIEGVEGGSRLVVRTVVP